MTQDNRPRDMSVAHFTWKSLNASSAPPTPPKPPCRGFSNLQIQPRQGKAALHLSSFEVLTAGKSTQERNFPLFSSLQLQQPETKLTGFCSFTDSSRQQVSQHNSLISCQESTEGLPSSYISTQVLMTRLLKQENKQTKP